MRDQPSSWETFNFEKHGKNNETEEENTVDDRNSE